MNRSDMEAKVLRLLFPLYTPPLRKLIADVYKQHRGRGWDPKIDEHMIAAIWAEFATELRDLNLEASASNSDESQDAARGELTESGRRALLEYLNEAQDWTELDDVEFFEKCDAISQQWESEAAAKRLALGAQRDRAAFFSGRRAKADFTFWCRKKMWTAEEAVALLLGKDPRVVNRSSLLSYKSVQGSPFRDQFGARLDDVSRAVAARELKDPDKPAAYIKWAKSEEIVLSPELDRGYSSKTKNASADDPNADIAAKRLHSYYHIVLGIFISQYGLNLSVDLEKQKVRYTEFLQMLKAEHAGVDLNTMKAIMREAFAWAHVKPEPLVLRARTRKSDPSAALPPPKIGNSQN